MGFTAADELWAPLIRGGASEQIFRRLGEAMGAGILRAGERLPSEPELAVRFGVSAMTVRQSLAVLRAEGYIQTRRGRSGGSYVADDIEERIAAVARRTPFTEEQLRELTDLRRAVSGEAAALAAERRNDADIAELERSLSVVDSTTDDSGSFRMNDARFHVLTAEIARSRRLIASETEIQEELTRLIVPLPGVKGVRSSSHQGHVEIVRHISDGDAAGARLSMILHAESTFDWLIGLHLGLSGEGARAADVTTPAPAPVVTGRSDESAPRAAR